MQRDAYPGRPGLSKYGNWVSKISMFSQGSVRNKRPVSVWRGSTLFDVNVPIRQVPGVVRATEFCDWRFILPGQPTRSRRHCLILVLAQSIIDNELTNLLLWSSALEAPVPRQRVGRYTGPGIRHDPWVLDVTLALGNLGLELGSVVIDD